MNGQVCDLHLHLPHIHLQPTSRRHVPSLCHLHLQRRRRFTRFGSLSSLTRGSLASEWHLPRDPGEVPLAAAAAPAAVVPAVRIHLVYPFATMPSGTIHDIRAEAI